MYVGKIVCIIKNNNLNNEIKLYNWLLLIRKCNRFHYIFYQKPLAMLSYYEVR